MKIAIMGREPSEAPSGFPLADAGFDGTLVDVGEGKIRALQDEGLTLIMPDAEVESGSLQKGDTVRLAVFGVPAEPADVGRERVEFPQVFYAREPAGGARATAQA